jgi:hypothetical protein
LVDAVKIEVSSEERGQSIQIRGRERPDHGWAGRGSISPLARRVW